MLKRLTLFTALALSAGVSQAQETPMTGPIYELAIQEVKPGMEEAWAARGITVRVDPPPVARDEALRTLRTGGEP